MSDLRDESAYRVLNARGEIFYPADDRKLDRARDGEQVDGPRSRAKSGEVVRDLPARSVKWLLDSGWIAPAHSSADPYGSTESRGE